jgi:hypothetical protein
MSSVQRVIKYCATAFAIILAIVIISSIVSVFSAVVNTASGRSHVIGHSNKESIDFTETFTDVRSLDIDNSTVNLSIIPGDTFKVDAENVSEDFKAEVNDNGRLSVSDDNHGIHFLWFNIHGFDNPNSKVTIYVPAEFIADEAKLDTGAGNVSIDGLQTEYLNISAGAGNITGSNIKAVKVKIDGGVGATDFSNVEFADSDIDCGVGNLTIDGVLLGRTKIDCGIGEVELTLKGNVDDYGWDIDSGIGNIRVNGNKISGKHEADKNSDNLIQIDGGIGNVKIVIEE